MESMTEAAIALDSRQQTAANLASRKWSQFLEASEVPEKSRNLIARLCENQMTWMRGLTEETRLSSIGSFEKFVFPMIRAVYPNLVAADLVSVQPMDSPTSLIFYRDTRFGTTKGNVNSGDTLFSSRTGYNDALGFNYTSETVESENIAPAGLIVGLNAIQLSDNGSGTSVFVPIRPGSLRIIYSSGNTGLTETLTDDGAGGVLSTAPADLAGGDTIDYATGLLSVTLVGLPSGANVLATYEYNSEGNDAIPELDLVLTSAPVVARPRKLRARWSIEAAAQLKAVHGDEAEVELMSDMANEMRIEVDREIINDLKALAEKNAIDGTITETTFPGTPPAGVSEYLHRQSFIYRIVEASNKIFQATRQFGATWLLCGTQVVDIIQGQEGEQFVPAGYDHQGSGVQYVGTLKGQWKIYHDPYLPQNEAIVGHRGSASALLSSGYVYAPWIPFYATPTIYLDDFIGRKGLFTSYAKKAVNGLYYAKLRIT